MSFRYRSNQISCTDQITYFASISRTGPKQCLSCKMGIVAGAIIIEKPTFKEAMQGDRKRGRR